MEHPEKKDASPSVEDGEGVRITEHAARRAPSALLYKLAALALVAASAGYLLMPRKTPPQTGEDQAGEHPRGQGAARSDHAAPATSVPAAVVPRRVAATQHVLASGGDPNDLSNYVKPGDPVPTAAEVIEELHRAGIHSGIGAFNPPGTSPPLVGLAVPEDYVLPEGYVRHSQATDDGQRIEPILMYSPDYEFFDANGRRIDIPANRVVPPNMAPPGLPVRLIDIPPALETRSPAP